MRKEFELTETEVLSIERITRGLKPGDEPKPGTIDRINAAWEALGKAHGFNWETVEQIDGKPYHQFTAEEITPEVGAQPPASAEEAAQVRKIKARAPRKPHSGHLKARKEKTEEDTGVRSENQDPDGLKETMAKIHGCDPKPPKK